jgi:hypothetical protein
MIQSLFGRHLDDGRHRFGRAPALADSVFESLLRSAAQDQVDPNSYRQNGLSPIAKILESHRPKKTGRLRELLFRYCLSRAVAFAIVAAIVSVAATLFCALDLHRGYVAEAHLQFDLAVKQDFETRSALLRSRRLAWAVIEAAKLPELPEFDPVLRGPSLIYRLMAPLGLASSPAEDTPEERILSSYCQRMSIQPSLDQREWVIKFRSVDEQLASTVVQLILNEYKNGPQRLQDTKTQYDVPTSNYRELFDPQFPLGAALFF